MIKPTKLVIYWVFSSDDNDGKIMYWLEPDVRRIDDGKVGGLIGRHADDYYVYDGLRANNLHRENKIFSSKFGTPLRFYTEDSWVAYFTSYLEFIHGMWLSHGINRISAEFEVIRLKRWKHLECLSLGSELQEEWISRN